MGLSHFLAIIIDAMILNINLCGNSASLIRYRSFFFWLGVDNFATKKQSVRVDIPSNTVISSFCHFFFCCCYGFFLFLIPFSKLFLFFYFLLRLNYIYSLLSHCFSGNIQPVPFLFLSVSLGLFNIRRQVLYLFFNLLLQ